MPAPEPAPRRTPSVSAAASIAYVYAMSTQAAPPPGTLAQTLRALRSRNFRLFFAGQTVSLIGTWIQQIAMSWLVYRLTGSAFMLGIVGFVATLPGVFITPFAGVAADRWNRHRMVIATQTGAMLQALALAALVLTGTVRVCRCPGGNRHGR